MKRVLIVLSVVLGAWMLSPTPSADASSWSSSQHEQGFRSWYAGVRDAWRDFWGGGHSGGGHGGGSAVPELDPGAAGGAIVLLLGGAAFIASRRREEDLA